MKTVKVEWVVQKKYSKDEWIDELEPFGREDRSLIWLKRRREMFPTLEFRIIERTTTVEEKVIQ